MTTIIIQIIIGIVLGLLSAWLKGPTPATYEQPRRPELTERLTDSLRRSGWLPCITLALLLQSGCSLLYPQTAIYVPSGEPVRLAAPIKRARVEVIGPNRSTTIRTMTIPAGWYCLPDPGPTQ